MSPKIFVYKGIQLMFFSDEHYPIHVHAIYGEMQMKVEFYLKQREIVLIKYKKVSGFDKFSPAKQRQLKEFIDEKKYEIIDKWISIFVFNEKNLKPSKINKL